MKRISAIFLLMTSLAGQAQNVKPLIETLWAQDYPFNLMEPVHEYNGLRVHPKAGCGGVAMAQLIRYHRYPAMSPDRKYAYDYGLMYRNFNGQQTRDELIAVSKLISDCSVAAFTQFGDEQSSTNMSNVMAALKRSFGYGNYMSLYDRTAFLTNGSDSLYRAILYRELREGRPVIYRGYSKEEKGHLFLIDGLKGNKVHVNMGWMGNRNGYYDLNKLAGYDEQQWMLTGIADSTWRPKAKTIHATAEGELSTLLSAEEKATTQHLVVTGKLRPHDFAILRRLTLQGVLSTIDLRQAEATAIPDSAFLGCHRLCHIALPQGAVRIGVSAFQGCDNLNRIVLPDSLRNIRSAAFYGCTHLIDISLPPGLQTIDQWAFSRCNGIFHLSVPDGVESIGQGAFARMKNLITLQLPRRLKRTYQNITMDCPRLKRLTIADDNPHFRIEGTTIQKK